ncbi:MAG: esterase/lipase family protein, partial [Saprospiraceae bacterium]
MKHVILLLAMIAAVFTSASAQCPTNNNQSVREGTTTIKTPPPPTVKPRGGTPPVFPGDRIVYWVHGLGGAPESWGVVGGATQFQAPGQEVPGYKPRRVTSLYPSYLQFNFSGASISLDNFLSSTGKSACINNNIEDPRVNFLIGHSQGGLISRATDKMYSDLGLEGERKFGGMVTFGSPHAGAMILNNETLLHQMGSEAIKALSAGPSKDLQKSLKIDFILKDEKLENVINRFGDVFGEHILPIVFKDQQQPIRKDYEVGAAPLAELNSYSTTLPSVAFFGVESEPIFYRTLSSLSVQNPNNFPPFSAMPDESMVDRFNNLLTQYEANYEHKRIRQQYLEDKGLPCDKWEWIIMTPFCAIWDTEYWQVRKSKIGWEKGKNWLLKSNNQYKTLIGSREVKLVQTTQWECICEGSGTNNQSIPVNDPKECEKYAKCYAVSSLGMVEVVTEKPTDGVVLAESAAAFPMATIGQEMKKSNHQQMR